MSTETHMEFLARDYAERKLAYEQAGMMNTAYITEAQKKESSIAYARLRDDYHRAERKYEAALKDRETLTPPVSAPIAVAPEVVGYLYDWVSNGQPVYNWFVLAADKSALDCQGCNNIRPLYAAPQFSAVPENTQPLVTVEMLVQAAAASLHPEAHDHFEAIDSGSNGEVYERIVNGINNQLSAVPVAAELMHAAADEIERLNAGWHAANVSAAVQAQGDANAKEHAVQQAQQWAQEARAQRSTVIGILRSLGLPENDWEAESLVAAKFAALQSTPVSDKVAVSHGDLSKPGLDLEGVPQPFAGAIVLLETIAECGAQAFYDGGQPTPNRELCLRFAKELRAAALSQPPAVEAPSEPFRHNNRKINGPAHAAGLLRSEAKNLISCMGEKRAIESGIHGSVELVAAYLATLAAPLPKADAASDDLRKHIQAVIAVNSTMRDADRVLLACAIAAALAPSAVQPSKYGSPELQALIVAKAMEDVQPAQAGEFIDGSGALVYLHGLVHGMGDKSKSQECANIVLAALEARTAAQPAQGTQAVPTHFSLINGGKVVREHRQDAPDGWLLYSAKDELIRGLNRFETDFIDSALAAAPKPPAVHQVMAGTVRLSKNFIDAVILAITETPDRDSPEDFPEGMIVTDEELRGIFESVCETFEESDQSILAAPVAPVTEREGWISVSERLPEDMASVNFVVDCKVKCWDYLHGRVLGGTYIKYQGFSVPGLTVNASYWKYAPNPPDAEETQS